MNKKPYFGQPLNFGHWSTDGLIGYWPFVEAGNLVDFSLDRNDGVITGAIWVGDGLFFDGSGDYVDGTFKHAPLATQANTFIIRMRWPFPGTSRVMYEAKDANNDQIIMVNQSSVSNLLNIQRFSNDSSFVFGIPLLGEETVTLACVYSGTGSTYSQVYLNGVPQTDVGGSSFGITGSANQWRLGRRFADTHDVTGDVYDVKVYNRALSASEIQQLYVNPDLPLHQFRPELRIFETVTPTGIPILRRRRECA